jgi:chorismate dehydratase
MTINNNNKIHISAVSYANTFPFLLGIDKKLKGDDFKISRDVPSTCAEKLINNEADIGLIPVATIPLVPNANIISKYCIGAVGAVETVLLMSKIPFDEIKTVYLDTESRTSVQLVKVLAQNLWNKDWEYKVLPSDYETNKNVNSMVLIGDKTKTTFNFPTTIDLSEEWMKLTSKPFVFAAWVANKEIPEDFIQRFNTALEYGVSNIQEAINTYGNGLNYDLNNYLNNCISYPLDKDKMEGLNIFLDYLHSIKK